MPAESGCCAGAGWVHLADLGHTQGIDCALVRCTACNRCWVHLWTPHASSGSYAALDEAAARELVAIPAVIAAGWRWRQVFFFSPPWLRWLHG